ncbi:MAG: OmpH family outer membrane protein [Candidatus Omnitrophica bacterium]|nr:OmpH family outer membrane protein [Candidatus Omnitrophota bacterium]MDD5488205.1 OmpH family outer membrane protein [Candidatus Omnitrophota bacterium]
MTGQMIKYCVKVVTVVTVLAVCAGPLAFAEGKIGYVDLRKAFYEYEKANSLDKQLTDLTEKRQNERKTKIDAITKLREEAELLSPEAKSKKQTEIDLKLVQLQEFDREARQELLTKKNDMFKEVITDIQNVVDDFGKKGDYDYILDSRNIMFSKPEFDMTDQVIKQLNKK